MQIEHKKLIENGKVVIYLNVYTEDNYEFAKDNLVSGARKKNISKEIKKYINKNLKYIAGTVIVIAINGIIIGATSLKDNIQESGKDVGESLYSQIEVYTGKETQNDVTISEVKDIEINEQTKEGKEEDTKIIEEKKENVTVPKNNNTTISKPINVNTSSNTNTTSKPTTENNSSQKEEIKQEITIEDNTETEKDNSIYIKLNTNGNVESIELETYIIGVVAAEMPASFNIEALKAQAVAARTYTMKKYSQGKTLMNSTSDQVFKTINQMKSEWGASFSTYYNKVKNAVNSTEGMVLTYGGTYIDAQYSSMTNGKTELPQYVWSFSRPYLQCVSSTWDTKVKNFQVTKEFSYDKLTNALGQTINKDTVIEVLSRTVSDRVDKIKIGEKTYTGTQVRSLLGLRSTDFTIVFNEDNVEITTKGYGHGVGMSQYGAHMAANEGYNYVQILKHYYVGAQLVHI